MRGRRRRKEGEFEFECRKWNAWVIRLALLSTVVELHLWLLLGCFPVDVLREGKLVIDRRES